MLAKLVLVNLLIVIATLSCAQELHQHVHQLPPFLQPSIHGVDQKQMKEFENYENLLTSYRQLFVRSLLNLDEVCNLFDFLSARTEEEDLTNASNKRQLKRSTVALKKKRSIPAISNENFIADTDLNNALFTETLMSLCHRDRNDDDDELDDLVMAKRGGKLVGTKVKFHSWGGKRNDNTPKDRSNPKIVVRTPFNSWGGRKRSDPGLQEMTSY